MSDKSLSEQLHEAYRTIDKIEMFICEIFEKYEPELYKYGFDFDIASDPYDDSIEIYFKSQMPEYPWEPGIEIRREIYNLGFGIVYWNFADENEVYTEEIRGFEPRKFKVYSVNNYDQEHSKFVWDKWKISFVDKRFDGDLWVGSKYDCRSLQNEIWEQRKLKNAN